MMSLNRNRLFKGFLDWQITLMSHRGSVWLKRVYNLDLQCKEQLLQDLFCNSYESSFRYKNLVQKSLKEHSDD